MSEVIVVTSGKGGVGKTTTAANIGTGIAATGRKVVVLDADIGLRNLDVIMGLENRVIYDLVNVIEGNCRLKQALVRDKHYENLFLLPADFFHRQHPDNHIPPPLFIAAGKTCLTAIRDARHSNPLFQRETDRREGCRHGRPRVEVQGQHDTCGGIVG